MNAHIADRADGRGFWKETAENVLKVVGILLCIAAVAYVAFWLYIAYAFRDYAFRF